MLHPPRRPHPEMIQRAKDILSKPENEQLALFLTTGPGEYARKAPPRGQILRFRNWQKYLRGIAEAHSAEEVIAESAKLARQEEVEADTC